MLDFGRYCKAFDYLDGKNLGIELGDIVLVKFRDIDYRGLVIDKLISHQDYVYQSDTNNKNIKYLNIEEILQKSIFNIWWKKWLESLADFYKVPKTRMIKTAIPSGFLGKSNKNKKNLTTFFWIELQSFDFSSYKLTQKQFEKKDKGDCNRCW